MTSSSHVKIRRVRLAALAVHSDAETTDHADDGPDLPGWDLHVSFTTDVDGKFETTPSSPRRTRSPPTARAAIQAPRRAGTSGAPARADFRARSVTHATSMATARVMVSSSMPVAVGTGLNRKFVTELQRLGVHTGFKLEDVEEERNDIESLERCPYGGLSSGAIRHRALQPPLLRTHPARRAHRDPQLPQGLAHPGASGASVHHR